MPVSVYSTYSATDVNVPTTAETVVATIVVPSTPNSSSVVTVEASCQLTVGTATTSITPRLRRGSTVAGALIGEADPLGVSGAAGSTEDVALSVDDTPGEVVNQSYVLTVQQAAATGAGTSVQAEIKATVR
jgi:hypothetical protein